MWQDGAAVAKIRFATEGTASYPDATFTLRLSYGVTRGYTENGEGTTPKGTKLPYFTTVRGAFDHAAEHGNKDPYKLADSWTKKKSRIKLDTPLNAVETADIIGGNSGSPVINRAGELVGFTTSHIARQSDLVGPPPGTSGTMGAPERMFGFRTAKVRSKGRTGTAASRTPRASCSPRAT